LFWTISPYLPKETRDYVPLMLAAGHIGKEPTRYGFGDLEYHAPFTFDTAGRNLAPGDRGRGRRRRERDLRSQPALRTEGDTPREDRRRPDPAGRSLAFESNFARVARGAREVRLAALRAPQSP